ncbi:hypothetical protein BJV74DRAFT_870333 [Russula compacta]|nr:hypothetical protein BJV74DRAFT_870333 [Russula compacta]
MYGDMAQLAPHPELNKRAFCASLVHNSVDNHHHHQLERGNRVTGKGSSDVVKHHLL